MRKGKGKYYARKENVGVAIKNICNGHPREYDPLVTHAQLFPGE
jgi:hypothetical protein